MPAPGTRDRRSPAAADDLDHPPFFAFFDRDATCGDCGRRFTFSASEQRFWYEQLAFWVQSHPIHCPQCRLRRRRRRDANTRLQELLRTADTADPQGR